MASQEAEHGAGILSPIARQEVKPDPERVRDDCGVSALDCVFLIITWVWVIAFAIMTISALIPPIAQGRGALTDGSAALSIICYWILPFSALGAAALFSYWFPDWYARHTKANSASSRQTPEPPLDC